MATCQVINQAINPLANSPGVPSISIFGGIATNIDTAPSAVFLAAFVIIAPIALWRGLSPQSRTWILLRPNVFIAARIATYIIRLITVHLDENLQPNTGLFIAELILEISGFNIICEPLVRVLEQNLHASAYNSGVQEPFVVIRILRMMRLGLLASLILGIYTGTQYGPGLTVDQINNLTQFRLATSGLNIAIVGLTIVFSAALHRAYNCTSRGTMFVLAVGCMLIIPSAYRLNSVVNGLDNCSTKTKVEFYVLGATFEFLGTLPFILFNLRDIFDLDYKHPSTGGGPIGMAVNGVRKAMGKQDTHVNHPPNNLPAHRQQQMMQRTAEQPYHGSVEEGIDEQKALP